MSLQLFGVYTPGEFFICRTAVLKFLIFQDFVYLFSVNSKISRSIVGRLIANRSILTLVFSKETAAKSWCDRISALKEIPELKDIGNSVIDSETGTPLEDEIPLEDINNFDDGDEDGDEENILVSEPEKVEEEKENFTKKRKIDYEKLEKNVLLTHHVRDVLAVSSLSDPHLYVCLVTKNAQIRLVLLKNLTPRRTSCLTSGYSCLNLKEII